MKNIAIKLFLISLLNCILWFKRFKKKRAFKNRDETETGLEETSNVQKTEKEGATAEQFRKTIGEWLMNHRQSKSMSIYRVAKDGKITISQVKAVEEGSTNYTINILSGYLTGCNLRISFHSE